VRKAQPPKDNHISRTAGHSPRGPVPEFNPVNPALSSRQINDPAFASFADILTNGHIKPFAIFKNHIEIADVQGGVDDFYFEFGVPVIAADFNDVVIGGEFHRSFPNHLPGRLDGERSQNEQDSSKIKNGCTHI